MGEVSQMGATTSREAVTAASLIAKARELVPVLKTRAADAKAARCIPHETIADFHDAGFFKILQPVRWGGFELPPQVFYDVQIIIASACPSSAWVLGVLAVHNWQLALFSLETQTEVWGDDPGVLISSSYMPVGKVRRVDGGYRLSGRWGFSSGSDHCQWAFLGAFVPPQTDDGAPDMRTFLVPRRDYKLEDTWHVSGLSATGSKDVIVEDAFIPERWTHRFASGFACENPGNEANPAPLYRLPFGQIFVRSVSTPAIGMAQGALEAYQEMMQAKISRASGKRGSDSGASQRVCAQAAATVDMAKLVLYRNFDEMMGCADRGEKIAIDKRVQYRYDSANAVVNCVAAVDALFAHSGSSAIFLDSPMQRFFQDIHACRAHFANNPEGPGQNYGQVLFGQRNQDYFI